MRSGYDTFALVSLFALVAAANAQPRNFDGREARFDAREARSENGSVFLDGEYLPPPYEIRIQENRLTINGRPASEPAAAAPQNEQRPQFDQLRPQFEGRPERRGPRGPGERRDFGPPLFPRPNEANHIREQLDRGATLVYLPGKPHVFLGPSQARDYFLACLASKDDRSENVEKLVSALGDQIDRDQWRKWLIDFDPPAAAVSAAKTELAELKRLDDAGRDAFQSQLRLKAFAYPLTILGMVLAVFALGHLLQSPPDNRLRPQSTRRCARHCRAAVISLVLIGLLSGLDLTWTLLASQAGQMTELNPIGSRMIEQPVLLSLLKVGSTLLSCGVLMVIRQHPRAQLATWWLCLVCTVLTFRWLVLNSMFVA